jgi:hypothetical protein
MRGGTRGGIVRKAHPFMRPFTTRRLASLTLTLTATLALVSAGSLATTAAATTTTATASTKGGTTGGYVTLAPNPCGTMSLAGGPSHVISHVVWVVFENMTSAKVLGSPTADPYLGSLAQSCGVATDYQSTPFSGAKMAMTSGTNWGITGDATPEPGPDLYSQLGTDWTQYMGGMTSNCQVAKTKTYYRTHNPATYFADAASACATRDVPLPSDPSRIDLSSAFTWIEADVPDSMHGCPTLCSASAAGRLAVGDAWARSVIPSLVASPQYQDGSTVIFVVWDQGGTNQSTTALIVVSPFVVPGTTSAVAYTHYSLLRGTEEYLGLPLLAAAAAPSTVSLAGAFGLPLPG